MKVSGTTEANVNIQVLPADLQRQAITIFNHNNNHPLYAEFDGVAGIAGANVDFTVFGAFLISTNHGFVGGEMVTLSTTGTLPAGLRAGVTYYVSVEDVDAFFLSTTLGGTPITITSAGTGTHTATVLGGWCINHDDNSLTLRVEEWPEIRGAVNLRAAHEIVYSVRTA